MVKREGKMIDEKLRKETEEVLKEMMLQPIAHHICDSGEAYGYQYERRDDLEERPYGKIEWETYDKGLYGIVSLNTYRLICEYLVIDHVVDAMFQAFLTANDEMGKHLWGTEAFEAFGDTIDKRVTCENTYNYDNALDTVLLVGTFSLDGSTEEFPSHIIISTHNGCDVRGGYSDPHVFTVKSSGDDIYSVLSPIGSVRCPECGREVGDFELQSIKLDKDEFTKSFKKGSDKWVFKDDKLYCPKCRKEVIVW